MKVKASSEALLSVQDGWKAAETSAVLQCAASLLT